MVPREAAYPPLVATLLGLCQGYLSRAGSVRDMAAACLGRLLTRPDCAGALADFVAWARTRLQATGPEAVFLIPGACPMQQHQSWAGSCKSGCFLYMLDNPIDHKVRTSPMLLRSVP